jgi:hypothetical protein
MEIGWTKAKEIARVMDEGNAEDLVELAQESTVEDLKDSIKESYSSGTGGSPAVRKVKFSFSLEASDAVLITNYIEDAKEQLGADNLNEVFEHIVTEWASEHLEVSKTSKTKRGASKVGKTK